MGRRRLMEDGPFLDNDMAEGGVWGDIAEETELPRSLFGRRLESSRRVLKSGQPSPISCGFGKKENRNPSCCDDSSINRDELDDIDVDFEDVQQGIRNVQVSTEVAAFSDDEDDDEVVFELNQREVNDIADKVLSDVYGINLGMRMVKPRHTLFQKGETFQYDTAEESDAYVSSGYEPGE